MRLLDFGLAQMAEAETLTAHGDVPGTLAYISPERLAGEDATAAADVWAVGVLLWEALAGWHPFWPTSMLDTARAIEAGAAPLAELRPDLPKPLLAARRPSALAQPGAAAVGGRARGGAARRVRQHGDGSARAAAGSSCPRATAIPPGRSPRPGSRRCSPAGRRRRCRSSRTAGRSDSRSPRRRPRSTASALGLAFALAVPVLPLGNVSLGLAIVYAAFAAAWLALAGASRAAGCCSRSGRCSRRSARSDSSRSPRSGSGRRPARRPRRARRCSRRPRRRDPPRGPARHGSRMRRSGLGIAGATDPLDVVGTLVRAATAQPALLVEAARSRPRPRSCRSPARAAAGAPPGSGALMLAATLLPVPAAPALPLVAAAWLTAAVVALRSDG